MAALDSQVERLILDRQKWSDLDNRTQDLIGSSHEYDKKVLQYSIKHQLRYRGNLVRLVKKNERDYYHDLLLYSRQHLMLFPYHLSDFIITGMRVTPFQYYLQMMIHIIELEKSYDALPNFTAADCLRLLGIGRNQYIDIMNQLRSTRRKFLGLGRKNVNELLPSKPSESIPIEPWWLVNAGYITEDDVRLMVNQSERLIIDRLVTPDGMTNQIRACDADEKLIRSLYLKGLTYLDVPIYDDDLIVVPPLEGFVMNRITGDYFETLLYKIFVSIDQNTSVQELANILQIDIQLVKNAVSMYCRLGFAYKRTVSIDFSKCHSSWQPRINQYHEMGIGMSEQVLASSQSKPVSHVPQLMIDLTNQDDSGGSIIMPDSAGVELPGVSKLSHSSSLLLSSSTSTRRIVFFYDSTLAAFLMMGNLSSKLKIHAVTMFEVGKLPDESIDSLLSELSKISGDSIDEDGYEAKRYYTHAMMLYRTIEFFRTDVNLASNLHKPGQVDQKIGLDLVRVESLSNLDAQSCQRLLKKNYQLMVSVAPLSHEVRFEAVSGLPHLGPGSPLINSLWFRLYLYHKTGYGPPSLLLTKGYRLPHLPRVFFQYTNLLITPWNRDPMCVSTGSALLTINETLAHFPVLVQAYPQQAPGTDVMISESEKAFVVLPISESDSEWSSIDAASPVFEKLGQIIELTRVCGYVTFVKCTSSDQEDEEKEEEKDQDESLGDQALNKNDENIASSVSLDCRDKEDASSTGVDDASSSGANDKTTTFHEKTEHTTYTLFDCHFGVPLFDRYLNKQVRDRISKKNLCDSDSLAKLVTNSEALTRDIEMFTRTLGRSNGTKVFDQQSTDMSSGDQRHFYAFDAANQHRCAVPMPSENLLFYAGSLFQFPIPQEAQMFACDNILSPLL